MLMKRIWISYYSSVLNCAAYLLTLIYFLQTGMLSIVVPPDFDTEATSSDMMVGEGGQVNIFPYFTSLYNFGS